MDAPPQPPLSSASPTFSFPFARLPLEIQHQICSLFCRHCGGWPSPSVTLSEEAGSSFKTLKALSETCHALNKIAQPILYHFPDVWKYAPFFKTVTARPDLAASVKVFARYYESAWHRFLHWPLPENKDDYAYLIELAQGLELNDNPDDCVDSWANDDANFKRCFECLEEMADGDQHGYTTDMAHQSYFALLTALHFTLLPQLEFAMFDLYDGLSEFRHAQLNSRQLLLPYPYLLQVVAANPDHFAHLHTVVFRSPFHFRQDSLGLERVAFLFPVLSNVRIAFFELLHGEQPRDYHEPQPLPPIAELGWSALPHLEEIYFDPCVRQKDPAPLIAISNTVQRCSRLKKLVYRHKFPDQYKPALFSPAELVKAVLPAKGTLLHLEVYCSNAKIPSFPSKTLIDFSLKGLTLLTKLVLDEELFCRHWLSHDDGEEDVVLDSCLVNILPENVSSLTVRLHDKFKAVPDIVQLGRDVASGHPSKLYFLQIYVLHDVTDPEDHYNLNRDADAFNNEYFLHAFEPENWENALQALAARIRPDILRAFDGTNVMVKVDYLHQVVFSYQRSPLE